MKSQSIEFKAVQVEEIIPEGDDFIVKGWAATYGNIDAGGDVCEKGCFTKTLNEMGQRIVLCYQHDMRNPIGKINKFEDKDYGLWFESRISDAEPDIKCKIKEGILKEFSIGFQTINANQATRDGKEVRSLTELKLYEVSLVTLAMNDKAVVESFKSELGINDLTDLENLFDKSIINENNSVKKHDLMILKKITLEMVKAAKAPENLEPDGNKNLLVDYIKNNFNLTKDGTR